MARKKEVAVNRKCPVNKKMMNPKDAARPARKKIPLSRVACGISGGINEWN